MIHSTKPVLIGYFDDSTNRICQKCSYKCEICLNNENYCMSCLLITNRKYDADTNTYKWQPSFSDSDEAVCMQCHASCQECQTKTTTFVSCNGTKKFLIRQYLFFSA